MARIKKAIVKLQNYAPKRRAGGGNPKLQSGHPDYVKPKGRPKGAIDKISRNIKEAIRDVFDELERTPGKTLYDWALKNQTAFYQIASKLIPLEVQGPGGGPVETHLTISFVDASQQLPKPEQPELIEGTVDERSLQ